MRILRLHIKLFRLLVTLGLLFGFVSMATADSNKEAKSSSDQGTLYSLEQIQQMTPEESVPAAYAKLERLVAASGKDIEITTDEFALWTENQFSTLQWSTLTDTPQTPSISIGPIHKSYPDGRRSLHFSANWIPLLPDWQPRQDDTGNRNVDEILKEWTQGAPWAAEVHALATFQVTFHLDGKGITYQAAMLFRKDEQQRLHLHPVDPIIQYLDEAIQQKPELLTDQVVIDLNTFRTNVDTMLGDGWAETPGVQEASVDDHPFPVLIQLSKGHLSLTGLDDPVSFDMDADGFAENTGWTGRDGSAAFLVLDRNDNGIIDDGRELFGTMTAQWETEDPSGFMALAFFDGASAGGNADGVISEDDTVFESLALWHDRDHDGLSDPSELTPLRDIGIGTIGLNMIPVSRSDTHGNQLRYGATVQFDTTATHHFGAMDVHFVSSQHQVTTP